MNTLHRKSSLLRRLTASAVTVAIVLGVAVAASGDVLKNDVALSGGVGQVRRVLDGDTTTVNYIISPTGNSCDAADGSPASVQITLPAGVTANPSSFTLSECDAPRSVTFSAGVGRHEIPAAVVTDANGQYNTAATAFRIEVDADADRDGHADAADNCPNAANTDQLDSDGDGVGDACDDGDGGGGSQNTPPAVLNAATDAYGSEGSVLSASGSFFDADGDQLILSADATAGAFVDNGDGTWRWSLSAGDDISEAMITVTATDTKGASIADQFQYRADNVPPALTALSLVEGDPAGCSAALTGSFEDPGYLDTHAGVVAWNDGATSAFTSSPFSAARTFTRAGTTTVEVTVADDDGGSATRSASHVTYNTPGGIKQPINGTGPRSAFKLGSTIPVKLGVTDCNGANVATLLPTVSVSKIDSLPDGTSTEAWYDATPTNGLAMRWDPIDQHYIYNLATKPLSAGDWKIRVSDASFRYPVVATVSIRK